MNLPPEIIEHILSFLDFDWESLRPLISDSQLQPYLSETIRSLPGHTFRKFHNLSKLHRLTHIEELSLNFDRNRPINDAFLRKKDLVISKVHLYSVNLEKPYQFCRKYSFDFTLMTIDYGGDTITLNKEGSVIKVTSRCDSKQKWTNPYIIHEFRSIYPNCELLSICEIPQYPTGPVGIWCGITGPTGQTGSVGVAEDRLENLLNTRKRSKAIPKKTKQLRHQAERSMRRNNRR